MNFFSVRAPSRATSQDSLEAALVALECFGNPTLRHSKVLNKWICTIDLRVGPAGLSAKVEGEYLDSPTAAVAHCATLVKAALGAAA